MQKKQQVKTYLSPFRNKFISPSYIHLRKKHERFRKIGRKNAHYVVIFHYYVINSALYRSCMGNLLSPGDQNVHLELD